ncbi:PIG-L family deacetylase [Limibacter armeniacum]|uniref:PIG-L family deacetylase n=1 Tax=Limibacter armeniacum TaxID=466084 RepID=UPI002FE50C52
MKQLTLLTLLITSFFTTYAQVKPTESLNASEIKAGLNKLGVLGSVMYMAAHPDDENTRMITHFSRGMGIRTAYLSLTRGDGGQNLIGKEIREQLGIIRTQELLAARHVDGGQQFFSRANDFGYSKNPEETLNIWDKEQVLADAVWAIRKFRPDVMVTRFSPDRGGLTHGHHTTSALIAVEAFEAAADPKRFPEQLKYVDTWQPKRILWNTSSWFFRTTGAEFDPSKYLSIDVGGYNALLGKSLGEIASTSRSQHKSQGFGAAMQRGMEIEYLSHLKGDKAENDLFEGIDLTWNRIKGGKKIAEKVKAINSNFSVENPAASVEALTSLLTDIRNLKDESAWVQIKEQEVEELILQCAGIWQEATSEAYSIAKGDSLSVRINLIRRSNTEVKVENIKVDELGTIKLEEATPAFNKMTSAEATFKVPAAYPISQPYWLAEKETKGMFVVSDQKVIGLPQNPAAVPVKITYNINGVNVNHEIPVLYKWTDPVDGERYRPLAVTPAITTNLQDKVMIFANGKGKAIKVLAKAQKANTSATVRPVVPEGWSVTPASVEVKLNDKFDEQLLTFMVTPPASASEATLKIESIVDGHTTSYELNVIDYAHIPIQTLFPSAEAKLVKLDIDRGGKELIGYIEGAGDAIPEALRAAGYTVDILENGDINAATLQKYDAVITGVRAYNVNPRMKFHQKELMKYVENGGNLIVQYNTSHRLVTNDLGPYPLQLSRDRVTVEEAEVTVLQPEHPLVNSPNKITAADFSNWVQERGLYFPNEWDEHYTPLFSMHDPGEEVKTGATLATQYGKGTYIYTGISWFRELPAAVPGAFRLFANMIAFDAEASLDSKAK